MATFNSQSLNSTIASWTTQVSQYQDFSHVPLFEEVETMCIWENLTTKIGALRVSFYPVEIHTIWRVMPNFRG